MAVQSANASEGDEFLLALQAFRVCATTGAHVIVHCHD